MGAPSALAADESDRVSDLAYRVRDGLCRDDIVLGPPMRAARRRLSRIPVGDGSTPGLDRRPSARGVELLGLDHAGAAGPGREDRIARSGAGAVDDHDGAGGVVIFKRQWQIARRFGARSQAQMLAFYYRSRGFAWLSTGVAVLFAVAFTAVQCSVLGRMMRTCRRRHRRGARHLAPCPDGGLLRDCRGPLCRWRPRRASMHNARSRHRRAFARGGLFRRRLRGAERGTGEVRRGSSACASLPHIGRRAVHAGRR